ncbi:MAG: redox-sensing transcriptional repressor Rex [Chitinivibrionales bacterium]
MKQETVQSLSLPTVRRLPLYLSLLQEAKKEGMEHISSALIARRLGFEPIQVRKDLAGCGAPGQPRVGFAVAGLITGIQKVLGWNNTQDALLVGAGNLGTALAGYDGFGAWGLRIAALFDVGEHVVGTKIHGRTVFHLNKLPALAKRMHVQIGILTVPAESAQQVAEMMVDAGIKAFWNFAGPKLQLPEGIVVERVDLAASLAVLSSKLVGTHR